jgi:hypothetical protein
MNQTEGNYEGDELDIVMEQLVMGMRGIPQPHCINSKLVSQYFAQI